MRYDLSEKSIAMTAHFRPIRPLYLIGAVFLPAITFLGLLWFIAIVLPAYVSVEGSRIILALTNVGVFGIIAGVYAIVLAVKFRTTKTRPFEVDVQSDGLTFTFESGEVWRYRWNDPQRGGALFDQSDDSAIPEFMRYRLELGAPFTLRTVLMMGKGMYGVIPLTQDAFHGILETARESGARLEPSWPRGGPKATVHYGRYVLPAAKT
jgi:hypothetical protein